MLCYMLLQETKNPQLAGGDISVLIRGLACGWLFLRPSTPRKLLPACHMHDCARVSVTSKMANTNWSD